VTKETTAYQLHFKENPTGVVRFAPKTVIYINGRQTAVLQNDCYARPTGAKRRGLGEYIAQSSLDLYFDGRFWSMGEGTLFTAYASKAKKLRPASPPGDNQINIL